MSDASARKYVIVGLQFLIAGMVLLVLSACEVPRTVFKDDLDVLGTSADIVVVGLTDQQLPIHAEEIVVIHVQGEPQVWAEVVVGVVAALVANDESFLFASAPDIPELLAGMGL